MMVLEGTLAGLLLYPSAGSCLGLLQSLLSLLYSTCAIYQLFVPFWTLRLVLELHDWLQFAESVLLNG